MNVNVDLIGANGQIAQGAIANQILSRGGFNANLMRPFLAEDGRVYVSFYKGGDPRDLKSYGVTPLQRNPLKVNSTLRRDEWIALDQAVLGIAEYRLGGWDDLVGRGLVYTIGNGMGSTVFEYHDIGDALSAEMTMDGITKAKADRVKFSTNYLPLPIIHADWEINARVLAASRTMGNPLDTTLAERAARRVAEMKEAMLFTNTSYTYGGGTIYSYVNHPDRNAYTLTAAWDASLATPATILADVLGMKQTSIDDYHYGPWQLYIPTAYETVMDDDYNTTSGKTLRERIMGIAGIQGIKVVDTLGADNVLMVEMKPETVRAIVGMGMTNVEWENEGGLVTHYKIMTIVVPQIRSDQNKRSGIVHATA